jgi:hypothetical protein
VTPYLTACACLGYDVPYVIEWLEFHRLVGVEKFFLYNNGDREAQRELLAPYVADGLVVLHDWPGLPAQPRAFKHCLEEHAGASRWMAFIDTDEFLFSPTDRSLPEVLSEYEEWPGIGVCRAFFGTSGHRAKPPGLVIESYVRRLTSHGGSIWVKSVVDPDNAIRPVNPHCFYFREGFAVDEQRRPLDNHSAASVTYERLRINHYWTRSEEEAAQKFARLRPDTGTEYPQERTIADLRALDERTGERDEAILPWVPALRRAVEDVERRRAAATAP